MSAAHGHVAAPLDVAAVRSEFPILGRPMRGRRLAFLDSAASAQKPRRVIDAISDVYESGYANIHRGVYELSERATARFEEVRETVRRFLGAPSSRGVVFVRNATEAINLVAWSLGRIRVASGDEILITGLEHHANIVPWQILCERTGARLRVAPIDDDGALRPEAVAAQLGERTRIVAVTQVSNALGTLVPVREIVDLAHAAGAAVLVDGAQGAPRLPVDVQDLGCDFYCFSGHKTYGPGVGVLWGREELLDEMPPFLGGGEMIERVTFEKSTFRRAPHRFEAGTPDIAGVIGLGVALEWLMELGMERVAAHEDEILEYAIARLSEVPGLRLVGSPPIRCGVVSFLLDGVHPHDVGTILDREGVAVRAGHHCAQPVMDRMGVPATVRASVGVYTDREDIDQLVRALGVCREIFA